MRHNEPQPGMRFHLPRPSLPCAVASQASPCRSRSPRQPSRRSPARPSPPLPCSPRRSWLALASAARPAAVERTPAARARARPSSSSSHPRWVSGAGPRRSRVTSRSHKPDRLHLQGEAETPSPPSPPSSAGPCLGATTNKTNNATFSREQLLIIVRLLKCNTLLPHDPTTDGHAHPMCCAPSARFQGERAPRVGPGFHRLVRERTCELPSSDVCSHLHTRP